jgi:hypothetical protein
LASNLLTGTVRTALLSIAILATGCQNLPVTPEPTQCEARASDYCARTPGGCPSARTFGAFCEWLAARGTPHEGFSPTGCEELNVNGYTISSAGGVSHAYLFDQDGGLAIVLERTPDGGACAAGPPRLPPFTCITFTIGYGCAQPAPRPACASDTVSRPCERAGE